MMRQEGGGGGNAKPAYTIKEIPHLPSSKPDLPEPLCISCFKWLIIVLGLAMLVIVMIIMCDVLYVWWMGGKEKGFLEPVMAVLYSRREEIKNMVVGGG
jgi:hypothetical protein